MDQYLQSTWFIDSGSPAVKKWANEVTAGATTPNQQAVLLFADVRDRIRYNPYTVVSDPDAYRSSAVLASESNWCIPKAVLLAAGARALGIPSRLGFADVLNHLTSEKLRSSMNNELFVRHGYTELHLDDRWVRVTPTFNRELCERFDLVTLDFDGHNDALLHPFDHAGHKHMEYVSHYPTAADLPLDDILADIRSAYGGLFGELDETPIGAADPVFDRRQTT